MTFDEAQTRLLIELKTQVRNGNLTERGMARLTGVSQPHIHNVLKGVRNLSPEIADRILKTFHLSVLDLTSPEELRIRLMTHQQHLVLRELPVIRALIGSNQPWRFEYSTRARLILPTPVSRTNAHLAAGRLQVDARMSGALGECDVAVVNTAEEARFPDDAAALYVVETAEGTAVRYLRPGFSGIYVATADALDAPADWELALDRAVAIRGRLVWIGREKDRHLPAHQRGCIL